VRNMAAPNKDDIYDDELTEEEAVPPVRLEQGFARFVVVDHIPIVKRDKEAKLISVLKKIFSLVGTVVDIYMPFAEEQSKGYAFIEYSKKDEAARAIKDLHNYKLDKSHTFLVNSFEDFEKYEKIPDEFVPPAVQEYQPTENLRAWLLEPHGVDQFVIHYGQETEIYWGTVGGPGERPRLECKRTNWTDSFVMWSPLGTYLVTFHELGVILWGGPSWNRLQRFKHPGVKLVDFSPNERYIVTFSQKAADNDDPQNPQAIIVWDVRTGEKKRGFAKINNNWPAFSWSHDSRYFARINPEMNGALSVYETPKMNLLHEKSITLHGPIQDFCWSPTESVFSAWIPEIKSIPARMFLMQVPSLNILQQKNLYNVKGCTMHWQSDGDFLCVKVDRQSGKDKKSVHTSFELFRMREKDIPIEVLEMKEGTQVVAFAWEPKERRFAVIHSSDSTTQTRNSISFYAMDSKHLKHLRTLEKRAADHLFWSPQGRFIVLAGLRSHNGVLEFFDVQDGETMALEEHLMATNVDWDPTGRYVATSVSYWRHQMENGYKIWSFCGKLLHQEIKEKFYQLLWRPRPPSLLTPEHEEMIEKNFQQYADKYKEEDARKMLERLKEEYEHKLKLRESFEALMRQREQEYKNDAEKRRALRGGAASDTEDDYVVVEEEVEEVISEEIVREEN
jgi:translation initiation factor 3 subunit B